MTASNSSSVMLTSIRSRRMPALFTRVSRPPKVSTAWLISRCEPSQSDTSSPLATASPPIALISSTTGSATPPLGPPPPPLDPLADRLGHLALGAPAVEVDAVVVHDDLGPLRREEQRLLPTDPP